VRRSAYVSLPDASLDGPNDRTDRHLRQEYLDYVGADAWDVHRMRNDSTISDDFQGQFRSTCECPSCGRTSVTHEAFNHVSLEIPALRVVVALVFRSVGDGAEEPWAVNPVRVAVKVKANATIGGELKRSLSQICDIPFDRLTMVEIYDNKIHQLLDDNNVVSSIGRNDLIAAYEVNPYTSNFIHAVISLRHIGIVPSDGDGNEETKEKKGLVRFGFPILMSFRSSSTCAEAREHIWRQVRRFCKSPASPPIETKNPGSIEDAVRAGLGGEKIPVRLVDGEEKPKEIKLGPAADPVANGVPTKFELLKRSVLPSSSSEISGCLGEDCTENFVFFAVDWLGPWDEQIDVDAGMRVINHPSVSHADGRPTLDDCFRNFGHPERLDRNNMWYCGRCETHRQGLKTIRVNRLPHILVVHLKRFESRNSFLRERLNTVVDFPICGLDMSRHISESDDFVERPAPAIYDLFAVTNHYGRMGFGHYTAFARNWDIGDGSWSLFDDSMVRPVAEADIVSSAAYILFYQRRLPDLYATND